MRAGAATVVLIAAVGACGSSETTAPEQSKTRARVEACTERFLARAEGLSAAEEEEARDYVDRTYCSRFAERGWVYDDGALSIEAHHWLLGAGSEECGTAQAGEPARTVPCESLDAGTEPERLDCAALHHVRRAEVKAYLTKIRGEREVVCDDGTALDRLGVP